MNLIKTKKTLHNGCTINDQTLHTNLNPLGWLKAVAGSKSLNYVYTVYIVQLDPTIPDPRVTNIHL